MGCRKVWFISLLQHVVSYPDPTPRREGSGDIRAFSWLCCVSSHMTLITCLHHCIICYYTLAERLISAFVIAISYLSLCSYVKVAKGYLCLHCQAGAVRSRDQSHVAADTAQPRKHSNVTRPFPSRGGVWVRDCPVCKSHKPQYPQYKWLVLWL